LVANKQKNFKFVKIFLDVAVYNKNRETSNLEFLWPLENLSAARLANSPPFL